MLDKSEKFMRRGLAALLMVLMAGLVPVAAEAHSASGKSYILINGKYTTENPVAAATTEAPEDLAPANYVAGQPVAFKVDAINFGQTAEFRWVWAEGSEQHDDGPAATHTFTKPGTYAVALEARFSTDTSYAEAGTVAVNVIPSAGYQLPAAKVAVTPKTLVEGFTVDFEANASHDPAAKIAGYAWEFGDGATAEGRSVRHVYKSREFAASPYLKVTDSNGLVSEVAFDLHNQGAAVVVGDIEGLPGVASLSRRSSGAAWLLLGLTLVVLGVVAAGATAHRKRRARRKARHAR
jgi:hypothetical protein